MTQLLVLGSLQLMDVVGNEFNVFIGGSSLLTPDVKSPCLSQREHLGRTRIYPCLQYPTAVMDVGNRMLAFVPVVKRCTPGTLSNINVQGGEVVDNVFSVSRKLCSDLAVHTASGAKVRTKGLRLGDLEELIPYVLFLGSGTCNRLRNLLTTAWVRECV